jgi:hypothetical protein
MVDLARRLGGRLPFGLGGDPNLPLTYRRRHYLTAAAFVVAVALSVPVFFPAEGRDEL